MVLVSHRGPEPPSPLILPTSTSNWYSRVTLGGGGVLGEVDLGVLAAARPGGLHAAAGLIEPDLHGVHELLALTAALLNPHRGLFSAAEAAHEEGREDLLPTSTRALLHLRRDDGARVLAISAGRARGAPANQEFGLVHPRHRRQLRQLEVGAAAFPGLPPR